jgi:Tyrosine-protein kinase ephrin type A/B receptor-like/Secretion system C-terminal sorting domain
MTLPLRVSVPIALRALSMQLQVRLVQCLDCPAGTYSDISGSSNCNDCPTGTYNPNIAANTAGACINCPAGTYNDVGGASTCINCLAGTFNPNTGSNLSSACANCPVGQFSALGAANCNDCPIGTYNPNIGAEVCTDCPTNFTTPSTGSTSVNDCSISLPITLEFFEVKLNQRIVELHWATQTEQNNSFFTVQKSTNGHDFITIAKILGHGTTTQRHQYTANDPFPTKGVNYYRLRQVDFDGTVHYSPLVHVDIAFDATIETYPNPATDRIAVSHPDATISRIEVFDVQGQLVERIDYPETHIALLNCTQWVAGTYTLAITTDSASMVKVVVKR